MPGPDTAVQKLHQLMERIYAPILELARQHKLPVIDLPNSFDINDDSLYISQIEPGARGGERIAQLIAHVVQHHSFDESLFYRLSQQQPSMVGGLQQPSTCNTPSVFTAKNEGQWRVLL